MEDNFRYFEVELNFLAETGAAVLVTARSDEEARSIAEDIFKDHTNLKIVKITDMTTTDKQPALLLN